MNLQPVPAAWALEGNFLGLEPDLIQANVRELLRRHREFFDEEMNRLECEFVQNGDMYEETQALSEIDQVLERLAEPGLSWWRLTLGRIDVTLDSTLNPGLAVPIQEFVRVIVDFDHLMLRVEPFVAGKREQRPSSTFLHGG